MDHLDEHLASAAVSHKYDPAIRIAEAMGKITLNRYYDRTDHSELYRIAMVLHPRHKLSYFQRAGWSPDWIAMAKKIVHDEFDRSYRFRDDIVISTGSEDADDAVLSKNVFDNLPAFRSIQYGTLDELSRYLAAIMPEDVKNEDILAWWYGRKHVYPNLHRMALDYHTIPFPLSTWNESSVKTVYFYLMSAIAFLQNRRVHSYVSMTGADAVL